MRRRGGRGTALVYLELTWKKAFLLLPRFVLTILGTILVLAAAAFILYAAGREGTVLPRVSVAVVTEDGDLTTGMGARLAEKMDSVKSVCDFHYLNEEEAEQALREGTVQAAVYLTRDIYNDINNGINTPVRIRITEDSGLAVQTFQDLVNVGISMLQTGESAVYAIDETAVTYPVTRPVPDLMDQLAMKFLALALNRSGAFRVTTLSAYGNITITGFYLATGLLFVTVVLFGMSFAALYGQEEKTAGICLRRNGAGPVWQSLCRISAMTFILWVLLGFCSWLLTEATKAADFRIWHFLMLLPLAFSAAGFLHFVYSLAGGQEGSLVCLLSGILIFVFGGGLFPSSMLPGGLSRICSMLPVQYWQRYLADLFWNGFSAADLIKILFAGMLCGLAGVVGLYVHER